MECVLDFLFQNVIDDRIVFHRFNSEIIEKLRHQNGSLRNKLKKLSSQLDKAVEKAQYKNSRKEHSQTGAEGDESVNTELEK